MEVMGSIIELCIMGVLVGTHVLPGTLLAHGFHGVFDCSSALMWQLWLVCGPQLANLVQVLWDVRVICSDWGTESGIANTKNFLREWAQNVLHTQLPSGLFSEEFLFPLAVHAPDWNHVTSSCLQDALQGVLQWPSILEQLRDLCRFLKIKDYRITCRML